MEGEPVKLLGRVKGNLTRSEFTFYDGGKSSKVAKGKIDVRQEMGAVVYRIEKNKLRTMDVITPVVSQASGAWALLLLFLPFFTQRR